MPFFFCGNIDHELEDELPVMSTTVALKQGCPTQISWWAKKNWAIHTGKILCLYQFIGWICQENNLKAQNVGLGLAGQIKSFHGPHLARGPYIVHAWVKESSIDGV